MYPPHHLGGYELVWRAAVRHLRGRGHDVRVLTTGFRLPAPGEPEDEVVDGGLQGSPAGSNDVLCSHFVGILAALDRPALRVRVRRGHSGRA